MVKRSLLWTALATTFAALTQSVLADNVIELNQDNFEDKVMDQDLMLVEFYAPWCGHCKALAPEYEKAATELKDSIDLGKVDCTANTELCNSYEVRGYPTLKVFRKGNTSEYKGPRQAPGIVSYMKKQAAPAVSDLNADNFDDFKKSDKAVIVGYVSSSDETNQAALKALAEEMRDDFFFGVVTDDALAKKHNVDSVPALVVYKQFDEDVDGGRNEWTKDLSDKKAVADFIKTSTVPLLGQVDASNFGSYAESGLPLAYIFAESEEQAEPLVTALKPVAQKYKGKVNFVHIDASKYGAHAGNVGLKEQWPAFGIQHLDTGAKYPFDQTKDITTSNIDAFLADYDAGKIAPTLKSADAPEDNNGPVKVVVANEFNDIVLDKSKDAFVEVYAPWCGHCKRLAPIWEELGTAVKDQGLQDKLVVAKLDGTENDIPPEGGFSVQGFPTLKFFKAKTNEMVDYEGSRTLEDLVKFVNEHSANGVKLTVDGEETEDASTGHDEL
ncbi:protein disulfide-isomerase domain [Lichtheimia ornata]|uniref:Protein disulfide-isomerase n=1 Tax=Lichtheimia ornata TaxID=688661 RepID=A0AAD7V654_9FUNG|nr:protein disulfide-isomerase domain [Lichtheimia ornata]KAJ8659221.1 protein disulfide-isomerase domain [Lichtheimia ornata]